MSTLITNQNDISTAETADLVYTYNTLEGKSIKKFETRAVAERKVAMAILAAEDRAGHKGVPANTKPQAINGRVTEDAMEGPKQAQVAPKVTKSDSLKTKAPKAPKEPAGVKTLTITKSGQDDSGIRPSTFRGQILQTIQVAGAKGVSKEEVIALHGKYTADVVCKFKRLGLITESVIG